jgi:hypothetical protein
MFRTPLEVRHTAGDDWRLTAPLVFEGNDEFFVIRAGFSTDFASIPRPFRWMFDSAGHNAEAGVLHDAAWRESKRTEGARIDPWDADGLFRRALRMNGATAAARGTMWVAVRTVAILSGRFGRRGPSLGWKLVQVIGMLLVAVGALGVPTIAVLGGLVLFWLVSWVIAPFWFFFERHWKDRTNWPWPVGRRPREESIEEAIEHLVILRKDEPRGQVLAAELTQRPSRLSEERLREILGSGEIDLRPEPAPGPPSEEPARS